MNKIIIILTLTSCLNAFGECIKDGEIQFTYKNLDKKVKRAYCVGKTFKDIYSKDCKDGKCLDLEKLKKMKVNKRTDWSTKGFQLCHYIVRDKCVFF